MAGLTDSQVFQVRELRKRGVWSGRIAELLDVDERYVLVALHGEPDADRLVDDLEHDEPDTDDEPTTDETQAPPRPERAPADPNAWPPPVDERTEWDEVLISRGYAKGVDRVRVRWVRLWGQRVRINDAGRVWCHYCLRSQTVAALGHPYNGCPVGLPVRGGIASVSEDEMVREAERWRPESSLDAYFRSQLS